LAKTYADGVGVTYTLTNDGRTATRTHARGKVTTYTYNDYGELVSQDYLDDTTDIAMAYDNLGRVTQITDAAGVTTLTYNQYGELETEANLRTLMRHYDDYGRYKGRTETDSDGTSRYYDDYGRYKGKREAD
jgi:YD repeat-containing protein